MRNTDDMLREVLNNMGTKQTTDNLLIEGETEPPTPQQQAEGVEEVQHFYVLSEERLQQILAGELDQEQNIVDSTVAQGTTQPDAGSDQGTTLEEEKEEDQPAPPPAQSQVQSCTWQSQVSTDTLQKPSHPVQKLRKVTPSSLLVPLLLLLVLTIGAVTYFFLLPLTAMATITITPKAQTLHTDTTFTIATNPTAGEVQGRPFEPVSFTQSTTVPATGHGHDDATEARGVLTFYNSDNTPHTIPAGVSFDVNGVTIVTDEAITIQAAVPPLFGQAVVSAHATEFGAGGNIEAQTINTKCCGSEFITAINTTPFHGGQDARSYSYIQTSDIQNAASDLLNTLTPKSSAALTKEARPGEQLVTPLCSPHTIASHDPGEEATSVLVSVTQSCRSVAYALDSLHQLATNILAHSAPLTNYQQIGTTQVTVHGSTYVNNTATLNVSLFGTWVYTFSQQELAHLKTVIAGETTEKAETRLTNVPGIQKAHIQVQRFDFQDRLPNDPQHISIQFFYLVS